MTDTPQIKNQSSILRRTTIMKSQSSRLTPSPVPAMLTSLALLAQTVMAQQWTTNTLPPGLVAWWAAEGNLLDSAGAHDGGGSAAPTYAPGRFGQAFQFNGTDQSVSIPDLYADLDSWTQFTLEAWINMDRTDDFEASAPGRMVFSKVGNAADEVHFNQGYQFGPYDNATRITLAFNTNGQAWPGFITEADLGEPLLTNTWYHLVGTYDHNAAKIYLNGVPLVTNIIGPVTLQDSGSSLRISKDDNLNAPFAGRIDDARIYNRELTATEVSRLALGLPGANGVWGLKTHDPLSQPPTTMFWFDEQGANYRELGRVTLAGVDIEADGLAMSPGGGLFAFQVDAPGGSRLLTLDATTAAASVVGPVLLGRNFRGATFTLSGRLLAFDFTRAELVEVSPGTGLEIGPAVPLSANLNATSTAGDLTQMPDGSLLFAYDKFIYRLNPGTGSLVLLHEDLAPLADGFVPFSCGVVCAPGSEPANKLFCYDAAQHDDVYQYLPSTAFARVQLFDDIVPGYNAGRGDLAALPAARVELLNFSVHGASATLETVCRGGLSAWVEFTDDLSTPNWQTVPGTRTLIPYSDGSIATPKTWTNLPATAQRRFFRIATQ